MELPVGKGRIWRVVLRQRTGAASGAAGALEGDAGSSWCRRCRIRRAGGATRRSGCWSSAATRAVAPALKTLAASAPDWRTRLHALWTLDGLDAIDVASVRKALGDVNADVRASAVRLSERWLDSDQALRTAVIALVDDKNWNVRRQVAASIGEMPAADRVDAGGRRCSRATARIRSSSMRRSAA